MHSCLLLMFFVGLVGTCTQVGYVLGRMEGAAPVQSGRAYYASSMSSPPAAKAAAAAAATASRQGHITSLAVLPEFRRLGVFFSECVLTRAELVADAF